MMYEYPVTGIRCETITCNDIIILVSLLAVDHI